MPPQLLHQDSPRSVVESNDFFSKGQRQHHTLTSSEQPHSIEVRPCIPLVETIGLESFIRTIVKQLDLKLVDEVEFDMNSQGLIYNWKDVFEVEKTYTACLGIAKRLYTCRGYYHEPARQLTYFVLEERNERTIGPAFDFHVMVFCYYNSTRHVTKVVVQYDQLSFYLHCVGLVGFYKWMTGKVITPLGMGWMRLYKATGLVLHPVTFLFQVLMIPLVIIWYFLYYGA